MKKETFQNMIRRILKEEVEKKNAIGGKSLARVPEMNANGVNPDKKMHKTFGSDDNSRDKNGKEQLLADIGEIIKGKDGVVANWTDHDDLMVNARDLRFIRISPRWEDYYVIEMMTRNEDRILVTGLDWEHVKEFVKHNLEHLTKNPTYVEKAYDKSYRNREDQTDKTPDKGLSQENKPKIKPYTNEPPSETKNKDKDYTEPMIKDENDWPTKPMKTVDGFKKQDEHKVNNPNTLVRKFPNSKIIAGKRKT